MDKTFCLQFWCCISFTLNRSELGSEFTWVTLRFYRWLGDPDGDVHLTPQMPSKQTPLFPLANKSYLLVRWRCWGLWMPQPPEKKHRLISFQMGRLCSSLRAHTVHHSEHDLINFWLWTVGVELWPNQCAHLEGKIQTTSCLSIP